MAYRTIQFQIAHEILRIMREDNGKPWRDSPGNVHAIWEFIYYDQELPIFMKHMGSEITRLYKEVVTPEYITKINKIVS